MVRALGLKAYPRTRYFGAVYDLATTTLIGECAFYLSPEGIPGKIETVAWSKTVKPALTGF